MQKTGYSEILSGSPGMCHQEHFRLIMHLIFSSIFVIECSENLYCCHFFLFLIEEVLLLDPKGSFGGGGEKVQSQQHRHQESGKRHTADSFI